MHTNEELDASFTTSSSSISTSSLLSRLDLLHLMTKNLEQKRDSSRWGSEMGHKELMPLDLAVKETQSKGSLLDRIDSLESRLIQLCLLVESKFGSFSTSSEVQQKSPNMISPRSPRKRSPYSLSRLRLSRKGAEETSQVCVDKFPVTTRDMFSDTSSPNKLEQKSTNNDGFTGKKSKNCGSERGTSTTKRESKTGCLHFKLLRC